MGWSFDYEVNEGASTDGALVLRIAREKLSAYPLPQPFSLHGDTI